jgi:hypothetical protein
MPIMAGVIRSNPKRECLPVVTSNLQFIRPLKLQAIEDFVYEAREVLIRDIRGAENSFSLECDGFEVLKHRTRLSPEEFASKTAVTDIYIKETEALLKERFHALRVFAFGCVVSHRKHLLSQINS